jgi:hypothetical protein
VPCWFHWVFSDYFCACVSVCSFLWICQDRCVVIYVTVNSRSLLLPRSHPPDANIFAFSLTHVQVSGCRILQFAFGQIIYIS